MRQTSGFANLIGLLTAAAITLGGFAGGELRLVFGADEEVRVPQESLPLNLRRQIETAEASGRYHSRIETVRWDPKKTAIVVCDMWDRHWCKQGSERVRQLAGRMNEVIKAARDRGVLIVHCPSGTMDFYQETLQRKLAQAAPVVETKIPLERWCHLDENRESPLPIDDSDGGCDCEQPCQRGRPWTRQIAAIEIEKGDVVTDNAEAYYTFEQHGIDNVIVMGVHTNMCVLGRPFSIRQMVRQGKNVVLMRDMTDTMYNPKSAPFVSHFTGNDLTVAHIERYWCPTITSADFLGGKPFRFPADKRPHLVILSAEREYRTNETLPKFALEQLGRDFRVSYVYASEHDRNDLPGIDVLDEADVALFSVRRRVLPDEQLSVIRRFVDSGKPVIGIRTANHAFVLRGREPPEGLAAWEAFDAEVIGGNYRGHHGNELKTAVKLAPDAGDHPILAGVDVDGLRPNGSLYRVRPLVESARALLVGSVAGKSEEPVAWTNSRKNGGRVFYTSLGASADFDLSSFQHLLKNGIFWAAGLPTVARTLPNER